MELTLQALSKDQLIDVIRNVVVKNPDLRNVSSIYSQFFEQHLLDKISSIDEVASN